MIIIINNNNTNNTKKENNEDKELSKNNGSKLNIKKKSILNYLFVSFLKLDLEFSEDTVQLAVSALKKIENFINDCRSYVTGKMDGGCIDEPTLLMVVILNFLPAFPAGLL